MALRLTVRREALFNHVRATSASIPHLVPVIKGNGYGLGRAQLVALVEQLLPETTTVAVGTIHEAADVPERIAAHVMNPIGALDLEQAPTIPANAIPTVGSTHDVDVLARHGWKGRVVVKLASSMRRFGVSQSDFPALVQDIARIGGTIHSCSVHPPTAGTETERLAEIESWLPLLPECVTVSVSHLAAESLDRLRAANNARTIEARLGTALWHGTKSHFSLEADVIRTETCRSGEAAGYRASPVQGNGTIVVIGAGSAHGVMPLPNGDSPFHFARQRMELIEPPYMHSALAFVAAGQPCPDAGDMVDVQRPLTMVQPDIVSWV